MNHMVNQLPPLTCAMVGGVNGDGNHLHLVNQRAHDGETMICMDKVDQWIVLKICEFTNGPGAPVGKGGLVQSGAFR